MLKPFTFEDLQGARCRAKLFTTSITVNLFLVDGLLVDTGPASLAEEIVPFYRSVEIEQVALTHLHEDHCGLAAWLREELSVPVYCHPDSIGEAGRDMRLPLYRKLIWKERRAFEATPIPDELETPRHRFAVVRVPGHTRDHLAFHEPGRGWLFTGDFFLTSRPMVVFKDEDLSETMASLERLLALDFEVVFCTHSGVLKRGKRLMEEKLAYLRDLDGRVRDLRTKGWSNRAIDKKLFPERRSITVFSRGEWSSRNMVRTLGGRA